MSGVGCSQKGAPQKAAPRDASCRCKRRPPAHSCAPGKNGRKEPQKPRRRSNDRGSKDEPSWYPAKDPRQRSNKEKKFTPAKPFKMDVSPSIVKKKGGETGPLLLE